MKYKKEKKVYSGIDLFKLIAALLIVIMHCLGDTLGKQGELFVRNVTTLAVPFFFICSGYFFSLGLEQAKNEKEYVKKYVRRLINLYIIWGSFYLILKFPGYFSLYGKNPIYLLGYIILRL